LKFSAILSMFWEYKKSISLVKRGKRFFNGWPSAPFSYLKDSEKSPEIYLTIVI